MVVKLAATVGRKEMYSQTGGGAIVRGVRMTTAADNGSDEGQDEEHQPGVNGF